MTDNRFDEFGLDELDREAVAAWADADPEPTVHDDLPSMVRERAAEVAALRATMKQAEQVLQRIVVDTVVQEALDSRSAGELFSVSHMTIQRWVNKRHPDYFERGGAR